ncbi:Putative uncharacterized transposon-derived protein [Frankliniella fusca]|uniref:Uncharacterized transposon-derived protein n=1 Tax=Frankliniella fusca TaxID=407009 RepID=A0AAE1H3Q7_9NEOP|nr:Putative uncharacterized transposon-derived protein [Frankliniella fusca]KAK3932910.1 Putative uncharacterized transposon-derived protein [Frankliniella fusca]
MTSLEHSKKLVLIPHDTLTKLQDKTLLHPSNEVISELDSEMKKVLSQKASDSEKWKLYDQTLQRYLHFIKEKRRPAEILMSSAEETPQAKEENTNDDEVIRKRILDIVPSKSKQAASALFDILKSPRGHDWVSWEPHGAVKIEGVKIPQSNIIDLISDTSRSRKTAQAVGWMQFARVLKTLNTPLELVSNVQYKNFIRDQSGLGENPQSNQNEKQEVSQNGEQSVSGLNGALEKIYHNRSHPAGFSTPARLHAATNETISRNQIESFLQGEDSYTLHKPARKHFPRNVTYADTVDSCWQSDLADFSQLSKDNDGNKYIMIIIDVFSKYAWTVPISKKTASSVTDAVRQVFDSTERRCGYFSTDKGGEYDNKILKNLLKTQGITYFHTHNPDTKCSVAERFIRTLRMSLQKYFTHTGDYRYVDGLLNDVTHAYNNKYHRSIKMTPTEASNPSRMYEVYNNLYGKKLCQKKIKPKFHVGDHVRISREKRRFEKSSTWNWSDEIYKVSKVIPHLQPVYRVVDIDNGEELIGTFYSWELNKVKKPDHFRIEYIVKTRGKGASKKHLVHWRGYPVSSRSWIFDKDIIST